MGLNSKIKMSVESHGSDIDSNKSVMSDGGFIRSSNMFEEVEHFKISSWAELSLEL